MLRIATLIGLLALSASASWGESFTLASGPTKLVLNSESRSGTPADWTFAVDGINTVRTTITVHKLAYDPYHTPSFAISLAGGDRKWVLRLLSPTFRPPLMVRLEHWVGDTFLTQVPFPKPLGLNERLAVKIGWDAKGQVTVEAEGISETIALGAPVETLGFSAAVGEIAFDPLEIGRAPKAASDKWGPYRLR